MFSDTQSDTYVHADDEYQYATDNLESKLCTQTFVLNEEESGTPWYQALRIELVGTRNKQSFSQFFKQKDDLLYCSGIAGLMNQF